MQEIQETKIPSLGWEGPLEEEMSTHSSSLTWRVPMDRGAWRSTVHRVAKSWTQLKRLSTHRGFHMAAFVIVVIPLITVTGPRGAGQKQKGIWQSEGTTEQRKGVTVHFPAASMTRVTR